MGAAPGGLVHPEGSLRRLDPERRDYVYLDNGATDLARDNHCNTEVVRWTLREHGVTLAGPDPRSLVDPVSAEQLRADVRWAMREWADWLRPLTSYSRRGQGVVVLSYCRMLHTLETGSVSTKPAAGDWALGALDPEWASLIRQALADRPDPWAKVLEPATPDAIRRTMAFIDYALRLNRG